MMKMRGFALGGKSAALGTKSKLLLSCFTKLRLHGDFTKENFHLIFFLSVLAWMSENCDCH